MDWLCEAKPKLCWTLRQGLFDWVTIEFVTILGNFVSRFQFSIAVYSFSSPVFGITV